MITEFQIENFKSFSKKQSLSFSPITLIYGPNSAGKSSIIQSLMMLKQSMLAKDKDSDLVTSGEYINLGTFESLVHGQNPKSTMSFSIKYNSQATAKDFYHENSYNMLYSNSDIRNIELVYKNIDNTATLASCTFSSNDKNSEKVNYQLERGHKASSGIRFSLKDNSSLRKVIASKLKLRSNDGNAWNKLDTSLLESFKIGTHLNFPTIVSEIKTPLSEYTDKVIDDISATFKNIKYLGPLRSSPKRFYSDAINNHQRGQGKNNLGLGIYNSTEATKKKINRALRDFYIPYSIDAKDLGDRNTGQLISVQLKDLRNGAIVTPKDVGFGIGQVLPIILDAVICENKLITVEQPEIHLHPKLQAHLADLFIDSVSERSRNQWIIETHSEALMLRIQRRIREGKISKNLVSVLYIDVGEDGAQVTPITLDDDGDFATAWPAGFFEERLEEVFGG